MNLFNRNEKPGDSPQQPQVPPPTPAQPTADPPALKAEAVKPSEPVRSPATIQPITTATRTGANMPSVISKALKITGELESTEDIQIDGQIEGDVRGVGVKIGQNAKVKGTGYGEEGELAGSMEGKIESKKVILASTARMTGDIWHQE